MRRHAEPFRRVLSVFCLLIAFAAIGSASVAVTACDIPEIRTDERPPGPGPTSIGISVFVADFMGVDDVNQRIEVDLLLRLTWTDTRLADLAGCRVPVTAVWFPRALLANSANLRRANTQARDQVIIEPGGQVRYVQRLTGTISSYHSLNRFPFDSQVFEIVATFPENSADEVVFVTDGTAEISDRLNVEGWTVQGVTLQTGEENIDQFGRTFSTATLAISASRQSSYYVFRVLVLLTLVVAMSWVVFWVPAERFEFQIGLGATSMLTVIAFNLAIASNLPTLGYLTTMDKLVVWAVFLVFLSIVEALTAGLLSQTGRNAAALRLDRISRFVFPLLFFLGWAIVIGT